jgi:hypothetical protein
VWLPHRIERTSKTKGTEDKCVVTVDSYEIGGHVSDATFTAVFPEGWYVQDHVRKGYVAIGAGGVEEGFDPF